ncbi:fatty-acid--CoA ligase [Croceicoccus estronivorus]|uniref:AMP-binding protein n=1 Tax=Croceicoccus estronivorus TaxID=1172626 RepID=UPI00082AD15C|nr:AMP-binding protein [Croceicoccus estronivorus]OCC23483.1 fatty-acid--CoA ligase [Croceicoccus estronivorus]
MRGSHVGVIFGEEQRTWSEYADRVASAAGALRNLGVREGDRVAILSLTNMPYFELLAAVPHAGGIVVPLNWRWSVPELLDAVADCEPTVLLFDHTMAAAGRELAQARPEMKTVALSEGFGDLPYYAQLVADAEPVADAGRGGDDVYQLGYTGGTTGRSKAAMLSHRNVVSEATYCWAEGFLREDAVYLVNGPMFHAAGTWPSLSIIGSGGTAVLMAQFEPLEALKLIEAHGITETLLVPTAIQLMVEHPEFAAFDTSSLGKVLYGAAPITATLLDKASAALPHSQFIQCYGMTELSPVCAVLPHAFLEGEHRAKGRNRAAGRAIPAVQIKIVDENDNEVPRGEVGEVAVRGETMMLGYWRRPEETAEALRGGWMHTGDGGYMDEFGLVYVVDRVKDMIISGGENIYSTEVENAVASHPAVRQVAVIGIPHEKWGESVHAIIRIHDGVQVTEIEIIEHVRTQIAGYKTPRSITFFDGEFPVSPANKVLKRELRRPYWEGRQKAII